ncbi:MAG: hypothetical protein EPN86_05910 [Nanoarchaeota archaeon]|nr:MAG: hypothetical protein EPN86_05910 [Nanoarchaeota archaeon]
MPVKIYLDTNFLLIPAQFKVDIFSEIDRIVETPYAFYIFGQTFDELAKLEDKGLKLKREIAMTRELLKSKDLNIVRLPSNVKTVDDGLLQLTGSIVATQDLELRKKLAAKHTKMIVLRQKKYLELIG